MDQNTAQATPVVATNDTTILPPAPIEPEESATDTVQISTPTQEQSIENNTVVPNASNEFVVDTIEDTLQPASFSQPNNDLVQNPINVPNMETTSDSVTPEEREKLYKDLAEKMLESLESGTIEVEDSENSSEYILEHLDKVQTKTELMAFLEEVGNRWPIYKHLTTKEVTEENDQNKIEDIQNQLQQFVKEE